MRHIRTPGSAQAKQVQLAALEARVRSLLAQLNAARTERDLLRSQVEQLQADQAAEAWRHTEGG